MSGRLKRTAVKILAGIMLVLLGWPMPRMATFCNPAEGVILGCFTPTYFLLLVGYGLVVLAWALITLWAVVRLDGLRLETLRALIRRRPARFLLGFVTGVLLPAVLRTATDLGMIVLPTRFARELVLMPLIAAALGFGVAFLVLDDKTLEAIEAAIKGRLGPLADRLGGRRLLGREVDWPQVMVVGALGLLMALLLAQSAGPRLWDQSIVGDASFHVYIGQHMLHGGIPYVTVIYPYSPVRFLVSVLWGLGARLSGLPVVTFVRALDLVLGCAALALTYAISQRLTGRRIGGLLAVAILLGTEQIQLIYLGGPVFRMTAVTCMLLAIWLSQNRRWFWAALLAFLAGGLWPPAVVMVGAVGVAAFFSSGEDNPIQEGGNEVLPQGPPPAFGHLPLARGRKDRASTAGRNEGRWGSAQGGHGGWINWRAALKAAAGALVPLAIMVAALLIIGDAKEAYQQNVLALSMFLTEKSALRSASQEPVRTLMDIRLVLKIRKLILASPGDGELEVLMFVGWLLAPFVGGLRKVLREPQRAAPLLAALTMAPVVMYDYRGGVRDSIMLFANLTAFGALAVVWLFASPGGRRSTSTPWLRRLLGVVALVAVILVGSGESSNSIEAGYAILQGSLSEQVRLTEDVNRLLAPDDEVVSIGSAWFLVLSGRSNAVPPRSLEYEMRALQASGWSSDSFFAAIQAKNPTLILVPTTARPVYDHALLHEAYTNMGLLDTYQMWVYVRLDRADVKAVVSGWDLKPSP